MKAWLLVACLAAAACVQATPAVLPTPPQAIAAHAGSTIQSASDVADPVFGIHARAIGLERVVRLRQWQRKAGGYEQVWSSDRIGAEGMDAAHANPAEFPINGQRWWAKDAKVDGLPLTAAVLTAVESAADAQGGWAMLKPDPSQLPPNLAATFQPDGDALSTSQDPAHPQIGDVQVQWRMIASAPMPTGAVLIDGHWDMPASGAPAASASAASSPAQASPAAHEQITGGLGILSIAALIVLAFVVLLTIGIVGRRRR
ncbi:MAG: hypothetical protein JSR26_04755 [Proteobacteria bacterium]|nr:hypothetical protein [Pseudomonadota bacterium]